MTELEWLECNEPQKMLEFLARHFSANERKLSERKLRLFAVACSRRVWDWIDALGRHAVDVAEKFADGIATSEEMRAARLTCQGAGGQAAWYAAATNPTIAAHNAARSAQAGVANNDLLGSEDSELVAQAKLLRDVFANPFRPFTLDPSWVTSDVVTLAQAIYDYRDFNSLPAIACGLKTAGCDDQAILNHCLQPGVHVRGCWALDLLLGKE